MAKINNITQNILKNMVIDKFMEKRNAIDSELTEIKKRNGEIEKENREKVKEKIQQVMDNAQEEVKKLLKIAGFKLSGKYHAISIIPMFDGDGELSSYWDNYISSITPSSKRQDKLEADLNEIDKKCRHAIDELVLRANLGCKYDDVMEFINNLEV